MPHVYADVPRATADYRRQARKIRASFAAQPLLRHQALTTLAKQQNSIQPVALRERAIRTSARRVAPRSALNVAARYLPTEAGTATAAVERGFADHSNDRLRAGAFTYTDRVRLLSMAERLGIPRFRANLILALEQHRINPTPVTATKTASPASMSWLSNMLAIVMVEAAVVGLFVWACTL